MGESMTLMERVAELERKVEELDRLLHDLLGSDMVDEDS